MFTRLFVSCLAVAVGFAVLPVRSQGQSVNPPTGRVASVARYATGEFIAGCRVEPEPLHKHPYFGSLPIHRHFPEPLSLGRLHEMGVEELAVFCGPAAEEKPNGSGIEWAAAARLAKPVDLKTVMKAWRRSLVPREEAEAPNPEPVRLGDFDCFRVPAGSFFPPPREYGTLRFIDHEGQPADQGVNVGNIYEYRSYVEGKSKAEAIFTLDGLNEADLVAGRLPLELRLDVFLTYNPGNEFTSAKVELRNPKTGLRSEPIRIEAKSYVNRRLDIPRRLKAIDDKGKRDADLFKDLVSDGKLEVVLKGTERGIYIGVGEYDLNLRRQAFEFIFVTDREIVVAQTPETLQAMLESAAKPAALSKRLSQPGEIVIAANVRDDKDRKTFQQLARLISGGPGGNLWGDDLQALSGAVRLDQPKLVQITATFSDPKHAETARKQGIKTWSWDLRLPAQEQVGDAINACDVMANLNSLIAGYRTAFPRDESLTAEVRTAELLKVIHDALNQIQFKADAKVLSIEFTRPAGLSEIPKAAKYALANMDESMARDLFNREKFDLGVEILKRVTDRFPDHPAAWYRRAHQLSYNAPQLFDGYHVRYAWVRRGINVLLDGAEQNPGSTDTLYFAGQFIGDKIGGSVEHKAYRELFSKDEKLHERLAKYIDLEKAKSPDKKVDNWLAARLLFEHCIRRHEKGATSTILPVLFLSRPAVMQGRYADAVTREPERWFAESRTAWKGAEEMFDDLGRKTLTVGTDRVRLEDFSKRMDKFGPNDPTVKVIHWAWDRINYGYWLTRCWLEQERNVEDARAFGFAAAEQRKKADWQKGIEQSRRSLEILSGLAKQYPESMSDLYGDFWEIAEGYRKAQKQLGLADEESLAPILKSIEDAHSKVFRPFYWDPNDDPKSPDPN